MFATCQFSATDMGNMIINVLICVSGNSVCGLIGKKTNNTRFLASIITENEMYAESGVVVKTSVVGGRMLREAPSFG